MRQKIKVRLYNLLSDNIEDHILSGWNRAHKYTSYPTPEDIREQIYEAVTQGLTEIIDFEDEVI